MLDHVQNAVTSAARDAVPRVSSAFDDMASSLPSLRTISKLALGGAQVLLGSSEPVRAGSAPACSSPQLSCHNSSVVENLCCFNYPGGQFLLTSFWDTNPVVGPAYVWFPLAVDVDDANAEVVIRRCSRWHVRSFLENKRLKL